MVESLFFPALLFFICRTCYMCAFEGIPCQALYGSSVKSKARGGLFLTHHGYISSSRENKVQPLRMTATDNRYYQTRNRRVGCKSKQHNVQWNREGMGAIKVLSSIYLSTFGRWCWLRRIWASPSAKSHCWTRLDADILFHTQASSCHSGLHGSAYRLPWRL